MKNDTPIELSSLKVNSHFRDKNLGSLMCYINRSCEGKIIRVEV